MRPTIMCCDIVAYKVMFEYDRLLFIYKNHRYLTFDEPDFNSTRWKMQFNILHHLNKEL